MSDPFSLNNNSTNLLTPIDLAVTPTADKREPLLTNNVDNSGQNSQSSGNPLNNTANNARINLRSSSVEISQSQTSTVSNSSSEIAIISPEDAANTILQSIAQRLAQLQANGANAERLESALTNAENGFRQGVEEASDILQSLGRLDEEQSERISRVVERFEEGINTIRSNLSANQASVDEETTNTPTSALNNNSTTVGSLNKVEIFSQTETSIYKETLSNKNVLARRDIASRGDTPSQTEQLNNRLNRGSRANESGTENRIANQAVENRNIDRFRSTFQSSRAAFARQETIDLQIQTQDGDIVTLSFSANQQALLESRSGSFSTNNNSLSASRELAQFFGSTELSLSIQGEIDDDEFNALNDLFSQLSDLFNSFFGDDPNNALSQALALDINESEIAGLNLNLQLTESQSVVQRYREVSALGNEASAAKNTNNTTSASLGQLLQNIRDIAISRSENIDKTLVEELLSISFAAGSLEKLDALDADAVAQQVVETLSPVEIAQEDISELVE